jgi:hypothetical protein
MCPLVPGQSASIFLSADLDVVEGIDELLDRRVDGFRHVLAKFLKIFYAFVFGVFLIKFEIENENEGFENL